MYYLRSKLLLLSACMAMLLPAMAFGAGMFPDVLDQHPHKDAIESLARAGIINGNPDGNYYPDRSINRAEMLKLLYVASGRTAALPETGSRFTDVEPGSWYEAYVRNAAALNFVQGYSDGRFRPGSPVTKAEALKMVQTVFGFDVPNVTESDKDLIKFVDLSVAAWYTRWISSAYRFGILPIAGESGSRFYPDRELLRGEAAAYIWNALNVKEEAQKGTASSMSSSSSSYSSPTADIRVKEFPFSDNDVFDDTKPISYRFTTDGERTMILATVNVVGFYSSDITCRLYKLNESGFSGQYYLGNQTTNSCIVAAAVPPGEYQLQLQPLVAGAAYKVDAKLAASDGNDGFMDAQPLDPTTPRTATLEPNDLYDWYSFSVPQKMTGIISAAGTSTLNCIIYTPLSVDQFGFTGPECNEAYEFQPGKNYIVGVGRIGATDLPKQVTYTVKWQ